MFFLRNLEPGCSGAGQIGYAPMLLAHMLNRESFDKSFDLAHDLLRISALRHEAGCKTVIGKRPKQSGMEWAVRGANAISTLRCCHLSGRMGKFYEQKTA